MAIAERKWPRFKHRHSSRQNGSASGGLRESTLVWKCKRVRKCWADWSMGLLSLATVNWLPYLTQKNPWEDDCDSVVLWRGLSLPQEEKSREKNRNTILRHCMQGKPSVRDSTDVWSEQIHHSCVVSLLEGHFYFLTFLPDLHFHIVHTFHVAACKLLYGFISQRVT